MREPPVSLNILLTNDDGYDAPGIQTLYSALVAAGDNVHIVAPEVNQSAQGSSLGGVSALVQPFDVTEFSPGNYFVDGSPLVATKAGLEDLFAGQAPDLVISGTNHGDNTGESENISGTVNAAIAGLFDGVPAIAVSAGPDASGDYTAGFAHSAQFVVNLLGRLEASHAAGTPLLPAGEGLTINVPGSPTLSGVAVTTIDQESSTQFPIHQLPSGLYNSDSIPNTSPSGNPASEGAQFLTGHITVTPIDGNWTSSEGDRAALEARLGDLLGHPAPEAHPLNIMLVNDDGYQAPGIATMRDALLAEGYHVTVVAPAGNMSGTGTALTLSDFSVTQYDQGFFIGATPSTAVETGLDALLTGPDRPDLVASGINQGANTGLPAISSGTIGAAVASIFNYGIPAIAVSAGTDATGQVPDGLYASGADFVARLIADLQASEPASGGLLPAGTGLNVNIPVGADPSDYAFTVLDAATPSHISVAPGPNPGQAQFVFDGPVNTDNPHSEGTAFNDGAITITPLDANFASNDLSTYTTLADLLGVSFGQPGGAASLVPLAPGAVDWNAVAAQVEANFEATGHWFL
jgi:5'/3'-nucleotidase SurE